MQRAPLNYAALLRALKLRLILRQHQNPAHFGGFIFFRNPNGIEFAFAGFSPHTFSKQSPPIQSPIS